MLGVLKTCIVALGMECSRNKRSCIKNVLLRAPLDHFVLDHDIAGLCCGPPSPIGLPTIEIVEIVARACAYGWVPLRRDY